MCHWQKTTISQLLASHLPQLFVVSPLVTLPPPVHLRLRLSLHRCLSLHPSGVSSLAGYCFASHHANAYSPLAPPTLVPITSCCAPLVPLVHSGWLSGSLSSWQRLASASTSATEELSPSRGVDLDCEAKSLVQRHASDDEKNLIVIWLQTELIGKVVAMVIACIECKSEWLWIGEELFVVSNEFQNGLRSCRHCKEMWAKMAHPVVRVVGGPNWFWLAKRWKDLEQ